MTKKNIKNLAIVTILLSVGILRFSLLSTTYQYPSGEEAIYGLIAKELVETGKTTIKPYNVSYGGGTFIEAFLIALSFKLFGTVYGIVLGNFLWLLPGFCKTEFYAKRKRCHGSYKISEIGDITVIHNLSKPTRPRDVFK
ncbi:MAG: hypothetical protein AB1349_00275 [Elusimicrobiota bacterium]